jgi:high-affinity iron transporter
VWVGVGIAVMACAGVGVGLKLVSEQLPHRQQEALETVVALVAVAVVTWMIFWMRRHARGLRRELESSAGTALATGSVLALVGMAFFAVIREGFETAVFLLAAFDASSRPLAAGGGALLGVLAAVALGWGIYRGGVRIDLARFFRVTSVVLVLVAAGLVASGLHTAHEAAWLETFQRQVLDLEWLVEPGSVRAALLTGMLGLQPHPVEAEVAGYALYAIPMLLVVLWPRGLRPFRRAAVPSAAGGTR